MANNDSLHLVYLYVLHLQPLRTEPSRRLDRRSTNDEAGASWVATFGRIFCVVIVTLPVVIATGRCRPLVLLFLGQHCWKLIRP